MKQALVTGSSRGIGRAIALTLAREGFGVIVHCTANTQKAQEVCDEIVAAGGQARWVQAELSDPEQVERLADLAATADVLVLNASVQIKKEFQRITLEDCQLQLQTNFVASMRLIQSAVPYMQKNQWGRIVTIGSVQEKKPHPQMLVYSASKAAQTNMALSLAAQLAPFGITVNNIAPGVIYTDRNREALSDTVYAKIVTDSIPMGCYGTPEDCAGAVGMLCSEQGRYITGQSIYIDGGKSL